MSRLDNPGEGNMSAVSAFSQNQASRALETDSLARKIRFLMDSSDADNWVGAAGDAWQQRLASIIPTVAAAGTVAQRWKDGADSYRQSIANIDAQADAANTQITRAHHGLAAFNYVPSDVLATPTVQHKLAAYEDQIGSAQRTLWTLNTQRDHVDQAFANTLNWHTATGESRNWTTLQTLYGDVTTVSQLRTVQADLLATNTELAKKVIDRDASEEELAALSAFLQASTADPELASRFWLGLGGSDATAMITQAATDGYLDSGSNPPTPGSPAPEVVLAESIRASLATASTQWTEGQSRRFAHELWIDEDGGRTLNVAALGFIFDDPTKNPMSESFVVAMADEIDTWERGSFGGGDPPGPTIFFGLGVGGVDSASMQWLQMQVGDESEADHYSRIGDPMSRVLDTLASYPDAAWEWLSMNDTTLIHGVETAPGFENRVDYYSRRDWSADSWDGVSSLWGGALFADGGLMDGPPNTATWDAQCDVSARMVNGLADGLEIVRPGDLGDAGATSLATVLARLMPMASAQVFSQDFHTPSGPLVDPDRNVPGLDVLVTIPFFDSTALGELIGQVGNTSAGFAVLRTGVSEVESAIIATVPPDADLATWNVALEKVYKLEGTFAGALDGGAIMQGRMDDDVIRGLISNMETLWSLAPLPMPGGVAGDVTGLVAGEAQGGLVSWYTSQVVINEQLAIDMAQVNELAGSAMLDGQFQRWCDDPNLGINTLVDWPDPSGMDPNPPVLIDGGLTLEEWRNDLGVDYRNAAGSSIWKTTTN